MTAPVAIGAALFIYLALMGILCSALASKVSGKTVGVFIVGGMGLPLMLFVAWLISASGNSSGEQEKPITYGNPYKVGSTAHEHYTTGRDIAVDLVGRGQGPGSGMSDDVSLWCAEQLPKAVGHGNVSTAMTEGCISGA
ncbi:MULTISPECIES: hypothetical protein [Streptomyces]|uniref:hypothetical protein n=1 Tax=Streptomyces TaxID=1883 RepID=UPI000516AD05|nr:hypothetical protein [Streptomyces sp. CNS654]